jgi:hypothetical protein
MSTSVPAAEILGLRIPPMQDSVKGNLINQRLYRILSLATPQKDTESCFLLGLTFIYSSNTLLCEVSIKLLACWKYNAMLCQPIRVMLRTLIILTKGNMFLKQTQRHECYTIRHSVSADMCVCLKFFMRIKHFSAMQA